METPRERDAADYLRKHRVVELLDDLSSLLFFYRPEKPREFLLEQLKVLQQSGVTGPDLFDSTDLEAVYRILDPTSQRYITFAQYKQALSTLGVRNMNECPAGVNEDRISQETFTAEAIRGLQRSSATCKQQ